MEINSRQAVADRKKHLFQAAEFGDSSVFKTLSEDQLLKASSLRNEDGRSILQVAVSSSQAEVVEILSAASPSVVNRCDEDGWAPLHSAASSGDVKIMEILLNSGADVNMKNHGGCTALHYAASKGHLKIAESLISHGAKLNVKDKVGCTALHLAASTGNSELCEFLIGEGAKVDEVDRPGETSLMTVVVCHNKELAIQRMGVKRPLEVEDIPEPSFRQPRQRNCNKLILNTEESHITTLRVDSFGDAKSTFCKLQFEGLIEDGETDSASVNYKELIASAPQSLVTNTISGDGSVNGDTSGWSCFPGYIDFSVPRAPPNQFEDPYISLLNSPPRKDVPIGPNHQAEVPLWDPNASRTDFTGSIYFADNDRDQRLIGTCIISMPDFNDSSMDGVGIGRGRTNCSCLDVGSMRCVQQHVNEAREKLRETIGYEIFPELGLCDMGDEVARKWTPDEEHIFHEVVFSNPASCGGKFWKHLSAAFPSRTKKELISYYFNVFMLRRRAVQNRSYLLEIDSDDDEEQRGVHGDSYRNGSYPLDRDTEIDDDHQGPNGECYFVGGEEEDLTVESVDDQDLDASWVDEFWSEPQNVCVDKGNINHGTSEGKVGKEDGVR